MRRRLPGRAPVRLALAAMLAVGACTAPATTAPPKPSATPTGALTPTVPPKPTATALEPTPTPAPKPTPAPSTALILATYVPRQVLGVGADGVTQFGDFDFGRLPELVGAGINEIGAPIEFMSDDARRQQELRRDFVEAIKPYGITYYHGVPTYKPNDVIPAGQEPEDERFVGGAMWLDEPYAYFPRQAEADRLAASRTYVERLEGLLAEERRSPTSGGGGRWGPLPVANTLESLAWYDLAAGADGFWVEGLGGYYLQQIHFFNDAFALGIPETPENYVRLIAAFERGAARHFEATWGFGVYVGTPQALREAILDGLFDRGATYFFFWANHADATIGTDEAIALAGRLGERAAVQPPGRSEAELAIVIPAGYHVPGGIYCSVGLADRDGCIRGKGAEYTGGDLWNTFAVNPTGKGGPELSEGERNVLRALGEAIRDALAEEAEFDILVDDASLRPGYLDRYARVVRVGEE